MLRALTALTGLTCLALVAAMAPAAAQDKGGATQTSFQDWKVQCGNGGNCVALHQNEETIVALQPGSGDGATRISLFVLPDAGEGTPVGLRLESGWSAQLQVAGCQEKFCEAPVAPEKAKILVEQFKKEVGGVVAYQAGDKVAISPISLLGFTDALHHIGG